MGRGDIVVEAVELAEKLVRVRGGTFEGWLWYLLRPPVFMVKSDRIVIEYPNIDGTQILRYEIDKNTHEIKITRVEENKK